MDDPTHPARSKSEIATIAQTGPPLPETLQLLAPLAPTLKKLNLSDNKGIGGCELPGELLAPFTKLTVLVLRFMDLRGAWMGVPTHHTREHAHSFRRY